MTRTWLSFSWSYNTTSLPLICHFWNIYAYFFNVVCMEYTKLMLSYLQSNICVENKKHLRNYFLNDVLMLSAFFC